MQQSTGALERQVTKVTTLETEMDPLNIYPNPTTGKFTLELANEVEQGTIEITDLTGRLIYSSEITANKMAINLNNKPQGVYIIKVVSNGKIQVKNLILQ